MSVYLNKQEALVYTHVKADLITPLTVGEFEDNEMIWQPLPDTSDVRPIVLYGSYGAMQEVASNLLGYAARTPEVASNLASESRTGFFADLARERCDIGISAVEMSVQMTEIVVRSGTKDVLKGFKEVYGLE